MLLKHIQKDDTKYEFKETIYFDSKKRICSIYKNNDEKIN